MKFSESLRSAFRAPVKVSQAVFRWKRIDFSDSPPIFANSKPKSGSHLLLQIMHGLCQIAPYTYVADQPIRTVKAEGGRREQDEISADILAIPPGVIGWGYLDPTSQNITLLCQPGRLHYFIYRDPRDMLVSHVHYATDMHQGHGMHEHYSELENFNQRLNTAITGIDEGDLFMVSVQKRYEAVFGWLEQKHTLCLKFEDLIDNQATTLGRILDQFKVEGYDLPTERKEALSILTAAIQPNKSHTFRRGKTGGWRTSFTPENKALFKEVAGDLLIQLGYEKDNDW